MPLLLSLAVFAAMMVGLVGTVVPLLPGLVLIWAAALVGFLIDGFDTVAWITMVALTILTAAGTAAKYVLPARSEAATPASSMAVAAVTGMIGMFTVPIVGFPLGAALGFFAAESRRTRSGRAASATTVSAVKSYGKGALLEIGAGVTMIATWWLLVRP